LSFLNSSLTCLNDFGSTETIALTTSLSWSKFSPILSYVQTFVIIASRTVSLSDLGIFPAFKKAFDYECLYIRQNRRKFTPR
jgi:hypothetical protein